jgi:hypothetical protein
MSESVVLSIITAIVPKLVLYSALIAFFRVLLWLPNLIIETLRGSFLNWLLLRDVPPMQDFLSAGRDSAVARRGIHNRGFFTECR